MVRLPLGSLGSCQQCWGSSGILGVAHRAALALGLQDGDAETKGVLAGDLIAELQVVGKSWAFGNSTTVSLSVLLLCLKEHSHTF